MKATPPKLTVLRSVFAARKKPSKWVRDDLHPVDVFDAVDFVRDIESGKDRSLLFQSAIPYFSFLTDEARGYLLPDLLATFIPYPHEIITKVCDFQDARGRALIESLAAEERIAVAQFIQFLSEWEGMIPYSAEIRELASTFEECRSGCREPGDDASVDN
jgi:hypothetical protein